MLGATWGALGSSLEVLMGVLGHLAALIGVKEDVVNIQRSGNKGLLVGLADRHSASASKLLNSP